jgi:hypothetical protein
MAESYSYNTLNRQSQTEEICDPPAQLLARVLTTLLCIKIFLNKCHRRKLKEGFHWIGTRVGFVIKLNWIPEMGDRVPTGVSCPKGGSVTDCRGYCSETPSYVKVT